MSTVAQLQRCVLCKGETREGTTTLEFEFDVVTVVFEGVPAMLCDTCDEAYIDGPLGTAISGIATELAEKVSTSVQEHRGLSGTVVRTHVSEHGLAPGFAA
jgi:YgiT-type zinc finger domain-containing protein